MISKRIFKRFAGNLDKRTFMLTYNFVPDFVYKRSKKYYLESLVPYHGKHIKHTRKFQNDSTIVIGGTKFPSTGATLLFETKSEDDVERFVQGDPYFKNKLVSNYEIDELEILGNRTVKDCKNLLEYKAI